MLKYSTLKDEEVTSSLSHTVAGHFRFRFLQKRKTEIPFFILAEIENFSFPFIIIFLNFRPLDFCFPLINGLMTDRFKNKMENGNRFTVFVYRLLQK